MYCVGLGTVDNPRYVSTCDNFGYSTTSVKLFQFKEDEVNNIITMLRNRFQYKIFVIDQLGNVIFDTNNPKPKVEPKNSEAKGLTIKIRV